MTFVSFRKEVKAFYEYIGKTMQKYKSYAQLYIYLRKQRY